MREHLVELLRAAVSALQDAGIVDPAAAPTLHVERTRDKRHGDFATNLALQLKRAARVPPRELAQALVEALPPSAQVERVEVAGPGFVNFFLSAAAFQATVPAIHAAGPAYGCSSIGAAVPVQVEFVSANPTGPLHVGHGRGAAFGATVANLLEAVGYAVHREYYVNDGGRQMEILAASVWLRYLERCGERPPFPANGYRGTYVSDVAERLVDEDGPAFHTPWPEIAAGLPADATDGGDKEAYIDALVTRMQERLGERGMSRVMDVALRAILDDIRDDLAAFGVHYDRWYSERELVGSGAVERAVQRLNDGGHTYEANGALWFKAGEFGDEKDRVLIRDNGQPTYFAADVAYHLDKVERGFRRLVDVWGADHHGYAPRIHAALQALNAGADSLEVLLVQFAILYRGGERIPMSTRAGEFVTLRELRQEVGTDAARFFYVMRKNEQHLDFDLDLAKSQSHDNPVYYIQYAHARICSVFAQLTERGLTHDPVRGKAARQRLDESHEMELLVALSRYPEVVENAALGREPHLVAHYLRELAYAFHTYYNAHPFIVDEHELRDARLSLVAATRQVLRNGLGLLGVSAPESM